MLAIPGVIALLILAVLRRRLATPGLEEVPVPALGDGERLPARFHAFALAIAITTAGLLTFGLFGYHLAEQDLVRRRRCRSSTPAPWPRPHWPPSSPAWPSTGGRRHADGAAARRRAGAGPWSSSTGSGSRWWASCCGGAATGLQDSTVKALVADLVPRERLATAYGVFAAYQGVAALAGGAIAGLLYADHRVLLSAGTAVVMLLAYVPLRWALRHRAPGRLASCTGISDFATPGRVKAAGSSTRARSAAGLRRHGGGKLRSFDHCNPLGDLLMSHADHLTP